MSLEQQQSVCDKYASSLGISDVTLIGVVVNGTLAGVLANSSTAPYFNGGLPPGGATDFTDPANVGALNALRNHLIQFFGMALGCSDGSVPPYTGPSMSIVHQPLGIPQNVFDSFNQILVGVTAAANVSVADQQAILATLNTLQSAIVGTASPVSQSFCNRYSSALKVTNLQLLTLVVNQTVVAVVTDPITKPFFDGTANAGETNFLDPKNSAKLTNLENQLVQFFGMLLGCSDGTITPYGGPTMEVVHQPLHITGAAFEAFINDLCTVLTNNGVAAADVASVNSALQTFSTQITGYTPSNLVPSTEAWNGPNYITPGAVAIIVIFAIACAVIIGAVIAALSLSLSSSDSWDRL